MASSIRSCGRFGPAMLGTIVPGRARAPRRSAAPGTGRARGPAPWRTPRRGRPAPAARPVSVRYSSVAASIGKIAHVDPYSGRHVPDRRPVGHRHRGHAVAVELDELADDTVLAEHLGDGEHQVGRGGGPRQLAGEPEADDLRDQHGDRLAEHGRLRLDAAYSPAENAETVAHGGVRVGADTGVGVRGPALAVDRSLVMTTRARCSMFTWCTMPVPGGTTLEAAERALAPAQELEALAVALELELARSSRRRRGGRRRRRPRSGR